MISQAIDKISLWILRSTTAEQNKKLMLKEAIRREIIKKHEQEQRLQQLNQEIEKLQYSQADSETITEAIRREAEAKSRADSEAVMTIASLIKAQRQQGEARAEPTATADKPSKARRKKARRQQKARQEAQPSKATEGQQKIAEPTIKSEVF